MQTNHNDTVTDSPDLAPSPRRRLKLWSGLTIGLLVAAAVIYYFLRPATNQPDTGGTIKSQEVVYNNQLTPYLDQSAPPGQRLSVKIPSGFKQVYSDPSSLQFMLSQVSGTPPATIGLIAESQVTSSSAPPPAAFGTSLINLNDASHDMSVMMVANFVSQRLPSYKLTLDPGSAWHNSKVSTAWQADFTGVSKNQAGAANLLIPPLTGKVVVAYGASQVYYFLVASQTSTWPQNLPVWQQVLNSLTLDQN